MNENASAQISEITVVKESATDDAIHTFTYEEWKPLYDANASYAYSFKPSKYCDFETGDNITITVKFAPSDIYFKGIVGLSDSTDDWKMTGELTNSDTQWVLTVPNANKDYEAQIQMWWMNENASAQISEITVVKEIAKSNPLILNGEAKKNVPVSSNTNSDDAASVSGNESVSGNNAENE